MNAVATPPRPTRDRIPVGRNRWVTIRPIEPRDAEGLSAFYAALSAETRYSRFLGTCRGIDECAARRFAAADHQTRDGVVAVLREAGSNDGGIVGHACLEPDGPYAEEIAFAVADQLLGQGIGTALMAGAIRSAKHRGIRRLTGTTLATNAPMNRLALHAGLPVDTHAQGDGVIQFELDLTNSRRDEPGSKGCDEPGGKQ
jgi:GNAT superfamily N-acetyltransferase